MLNHSPLTCAVCFKRKKEEPTHNLEQTLKSLEVTGRYAHPKCVIELQRKRTKERKRYGR